MHANNETGTLQPVAECAAVARAAHVPVHTDAAQSAGKIAIDVDTLGVDALSLAGVEPEKAMPASAPADAGLRTLRVPGRDGPKRPRQRRDRDRQERDGEHDAVFTMARATRCCPVAGHHPRQREREVLL